MQQILTRKKTSLITQVLQAQIEYPSDGDWYLVVMEDIEYLGLKETLTIETIAKLHKDKLKDMVKSAIQNTAFQELSERKKLSSKISPLTYNSLKIQPYLAAINIPTRIKQVQFKWRTRMVNVGWNFGIKSKCPLCHTADDDQLHLLICEVLSGGSGCQNLENESEQTFFRKVEKLLRKRDCILASDNGTVK